MVEHQKQKNAQQKQNENLRLRRKIENGREKNVNVLVRGAFCATKRAGISVLFFHFLFISKNAADGRWGAVCVGYPGKKAPSKAIAGIFRKVGAKYSGYRQV